MGKGARNKSIRRSVEAVTKGESPETTKSIARAIRRQLSKGRRYGPSRP